MDTNGYDYLVATPEAQAIAVEAHVQGVVEYLMTHVQIDQLNALLGTEKEWKAQAALEIPFVPIATHGVLLGVSKLGLARFDEEGAIDAIRGSSKQDDEDALLAETARCEEAVLVTGDKVLTKKARKVGVEVWTPKEFMAFIRTHIPDA